MKRKLTLFTLLALATLSVVNAQVVESFSPLNLPANLDSTVTLTIFGSGLTSSVEILPIPVEVGCAFLDDQGALVTIAGPTEATLELPGTDSVGEFLMCYRFDSGDAYSEFTVTNVLTLGVTTGFTFSTTDFTNTVVSNVADGTTQNVYVDGTYLHHEVLLFLVHEDLSGDPDVCNSVQFEGAWVGSNSEATKAAWSVTGIVESGTYVPCIAVPYQSEPFQLYETSVVFATNSDSSTDSSAATTDSSTDSSAATTDSSTDSSAATADGSTDSSAATADGSTDSSAATADGSVDGSGEVVEPDAIVVDVDPEILLVIPLSATSHTGTLELELIGGAFSNSSGFIGFGSVGSQSCDGLTAEQMHAITVVSDLLATSNVTISDAGVYPLCAMFSAEVVYLFDFEVFIPAVESFSPFQVPLADLSDSVSLEVLGSWLLPNEIGVRMEKIETLSVDESQLCANMSVSSSAIVHSISTNETSGTVNVTHSGPGPYVVCYERYVDGVAADLGGFFAPLCLGSLAINESEVVTKMGSTPMVSIAGENGDDIADSSESTLIFASLEPGSTFSAALIPFNDTLPGASVSVPISLKNSSGDTLWSIVDTNGEALFVDWCTWYANLTFTIPEFNSTGLTRYELHVGPTKSSDSNYDGIAATVVYVPSDSSTPSDGGTLPPAELFVVPTQSAKSVVEISSSTTSTPLSIFLDVDIVVEGGTPATLFLKPVEEPTGDFSVTITSTEPNEISLDGDTEYVVEVATWDEVRSVTVSALEDNLVDGEMEATIVLTSQSTETGAGPVTQVLAVTISDSNTASALLVANNVTVSETGTSQIMSVSLSSQPHSAVEVILSVNDTTEGFVVPETIRFEPSEWNVPQNVSVVGVKDSDNFETEPTPFAVEVIDFVSADKAYDLSSERPSLVFYSENAVFPLLLNVEPTTCSLVGCNLTILVGDPTATIRVYIGDLLILEQSIPDSEDTVSAEAEVTGGRRLQRGSKKSSSVAVQASVPVIDESGYHNITIENVNGGVVTLNEQIFLTEECPDTGWFGTGTTCQLCPEGGICPGGARVWPLPGYWGPDESIPVVGPCSAPDNRCLGTRMGLCLYGYTGEFCDECADTHYNRAGTCLPCRQSGDESEGALTIFVGLCFIGFISLSSLFFSAPVFDLIVWALTSIQLVANIGLMAKARLPSNIQHLYRYMSLILFDFEFIRPGCTVGKVEFWQLWLFTIGIGVLFPLPIALGLGRAAKKTRKAIKKLPKKETDKTKEEASFMTVHPSAATPKKPDPLATERVAHAEDPRSSPSLVDDTVFEDQDESKPDSDFEQEAEHSLQLREGENAKSLQAASPLPAKDKADRTDEEDDDSTVSKTRAILTVVMLTLSMILTRSMQAINCTRIGDELRLVTEKSTVCYEGIHIFVAIVSWIIVISSCVIVCYCLYAAALSPGKVRFTEDEKFMAKYDFLYGDYRDSLVFFFVFDLLVELVLSFCVAFLQNDASTQTTLTLVILSSHAALIIFTKAIKSLLVMALFLSGSFIGLYGTLANYISTREWYTESVKDGLEGTFFFVVVLQLVLLLVFVIREIRAIWFDRVSNEVDVQDEINDGRKDEVAEDLKAEVQTEGKEGTGEEDVDQKVDETEEMEEAMGNSSEPSTLDDKDSQGDGDGSSPVKGVRESASVHQEELPEVNSIPPAFPEESEFHDAKAVLSGDKELAQ